MRAISRVRAACRLAAAALTIAGLAGAQTDPLLSGLQAFHRGDYAAAERELMSSPDPRAKTFLALTLAATGRCEVAQPDLAKAFESSEVEIKRLAGLAVVQCDLAQERFDSAAIVVDRLRAQFPSDADVLYQAARLHMRAWNSVIYEMYQKTPASFRVNQISGEILETQGRFPEAAAEYRKAIEKSPQTLNLHFRLGRALLMSSHEPATLDAALKEFQSELALNPTDAVAHYQVAQVLLAQLKTTEAEASMARALELRPDFPEALVALGKLRVTENRNKEAIDLLERAVRLTPRNEAAHYSLMMAYRNSGNMAEARREKAELDKLQKTPEGEFTEFLKRIGEKPPDK